MGSVVGLIVGVFACGLGCCEFRFLDCVVLLFLFGFGLVG